MPSRSSIASSWPLLADPRPGRLHVERQRVVAAGDQPARRPGRHLRYRGDGGHLGIELRIEPAPGVRGERRRAQQVDLVGQADPDERAARALGAIDERRRRHVARRGGSQLPEELEGPRAQRRIDLDLHPLVRADEVQDAARHPIPVLLEDQRLCAQLHSLGLPRSLRNVRRLAPLVVDRSDHVAIGLDQIDLRDQPELGRRELHRSRVEARALELGGSGQGAGLHIDAPVMEPAIDRVRVVREVALHPLEVREPGTVRVLVEHPRRHELRRRDPRRSVRRADAGADGVEALALRRRRVRRHRAATGWGITGRLHRSRWGDAGRSATTRICRGPRRRPRLRRTAPHRAQRAGQDHVQRVDDPRVPVADDRHERIVHARVPPAQVRELAQELRLAPAPTCSSVPDAPAPGWLGHLSASPGHRRTRSGRAPRAPPPDRAPRPTSWRRDRCGGSPRARSPADWWCSSA